MGWQLRLLDKAYNARAVLPFSRAAWTEKMNRPDVLAVDGFTSDLRELRTPGWGAVLTDDLGKARFSGFTYNWQKTGAGTMSIVLTGDLYRVLGRIVYPVPTAVWENQVAAVRDTITGPAEDRLLHYIAANAGPAASLGRPVPGIVIAESLGRGPVATSEHRFTEFEDLLDRFENAAGTRVTAIRQPDGSLRLEVSFPPDLSNSAVGPRLADDNWTHGETLPGATTALVAGGGTGTARVTREIADAAAEADFGIRIEKFVDQRDTTVDADLVQGGVDALVEAQSVRELTANVVPDSILPVGLKAAIRIDDQVVIDRIREQTITIGGDDGPTVSVVPVFGSPDAGLTITQRQLRLVRRQLRRQERLES